MQFYVPVGPRGILFRVGTIWTGVMGSLTYWWTNRRPPHGPRPAALRECCEGSGAVTIDSATGDESERLVIGLSRRMTIPG